MRSPEQLRAEVRRLHLMIRNIADPEHRRVIAERALELAQQSEAIASFPNNVDVEGVSVRIAHYRNTLAASDDARNQRFLVELLQDADDKFQQISNPQRLPRQRRAARTVSGKTVGLRVKLIGNLAKFSRDLGGAPRQFAHLGHRHAQTRDGKTHPVRQITHARLLPCRRHQLAAVQFQPAAAQVPSFRGEQQPSTRCC